ncbi:MAG TPA: hypothetical protein DCR40_20680 [Prolixibacteraceae bacterium]|nr:hypothetical protein [Prolixibacteraceae bacterium]
MKLTVCAYVIFLLFSIACKKEVKDDLSINQIESLMKIFPESPSSKDEIKLVIYDDCAYNTLSKNKRTGKIIDIEKQFNSMMKWPCVQRNDTIPIGKLPEGTYTVNYKLLDISTQVTQPIAFSTSFDLVVSR